MTTTSHPQCCSTWSARCADAPKPSSATRSPGTTSARRSARYPITPAHNSGAASRSSSADGSLHRERLGHGHRVRVPAVDGPAGELRGDAEVLLTTRAEPAHPAGAVQPRHADAVPEGELLATVTERVDDTDHLVTGHDAAGAAARDRPRRRAGRCGSTRTRGRAAGPHAPRVPATGRSTRVSGRAVTGAAASSCCDAAHLLGSIPLRRPALRARLRCISRHDEGGLALDRGTARFDPGAEQLDVDLALAAVLVAARDPCPSTRPCRPATPARGTAPSSGGRSAAPSHSVAYPARMPAWSMPTENTDG